MKLDKFTGKLVCFSCYNERVGSRKAAREERTSSPALPGQAPKRKLIKFQCIKCKYRYERNEESRHKFMCPYCGSKQVEIRPEGDANKLLREASTDRYGW